MEKRWMLAPITLLGLSLMVNIPTPAQNTGNTAQEPTDQMKRKAEAQKKARRDQAGRSYREKSRRR